MGRAVISQGALRRAGTGERQLDAWTRRAASPPGALVAGGSKKEGAETSSAEVLAVGMGSPALYGRRVRFLKFMKWDWVTLTAMFTNKGKKEQAPSCIASAWRRQRGKNGRSRSGVCRVSARITHWAPEGEIRAEKEPFTNWLENKLH